MNQKRILLHVGFHKSGTTALQESLAAQREELRSLGVLYPEIGRKAHHRMAWALSQRTWGWKNRGGETTPARFWNLPAKRIDSAKEATAIISSEFFSELPIEQIRKIAGTFKHREVEIIFTLRPLVKLLGSSYQQYLKYGTKADYEEWLHSVLDEPGKSKINPTFWKRHMHGDVVARWVEVFGKDRVTVIVADEKRPQFLFENVDDCLGIPRGTLKAQETGSNRSLTMEEISLLLALNRLFPKERNWDEYLTFIRNGYVRELTDKVPIKEGKDRLLTPRWAIEKGNEIGELSKQKLLLTGVKILGNVDSLGSAVVPEGTPKYTNVVDTETVALSMMGMNRSVMRRIPNRWIFSELFRRFRIGWRAALRGELRL